MQVNNSQPSFGSTLIRGAAKMPVFNNKYTNDVITLTYPCVFLEGK